MTDIIAANDPALKSFLAAGPHSHFPIQNLPFGIFAAIDGPPRAGSIVGETVVDLAALAQAGKFPDLPDGVFAAPCLNPFMALGRDAWRATRERLSRLLRVDDAELQGDAALRQAALHAAADCRMLMPIAVAGYTDFYASRQHATNVGAMFRGKDNALMPNWLHLPVAYDGRAGSVRVSGTDFARPRGQVKGPGDAAPRFAASSKLDIELEVGLIIGTGSAFGDSVSVAEADRHIFGMVLLNDWSARDIQAWEYVPLGPFLGKNFCTSISPWVVTLDALRPFRCPAPAQDPAVLPYLDRAGEDWGLDVALEVKLADADRGPPGTIARSNVRYQYWDIRQMVAHHTVNGCPLAVGDLMGSGTISGDVEDSFGSLIELTWNGTRPLSLPSGATRTFLDDGDRVTLTGWAEGQGYRVGFGEVTGRVLPARQD